MDSSALIKNFFSISQNQELKLQKFLEELINSNKQTNLVGKSTLVNPWRSHILDSIQISSFIPKKTSSILDMGTGAGLPGLVLAMIGYTKVCLIDSSGKKIKFIREVCKKLNINVNIVLGRLEKIKTSRYDFLISRALANLSSLFTYSYNFIDNDSVLIFLKGKNFIEEIKEAKNEWIFKSEIHQSLSDDRGKILIINKLATKK